MEKRGAHFDLVDDETAPTEPGFADSMTSEHFLIAQKKKNEKKKSTGDLLGVPVKHDDGDDSDASNSSSYKTSIKTGAGDVKDSFVFKLKKNPTYQTYLEKTKERPEYLMTPKFLSKNSFESVVIASYQRSGCTLLRKYLENITGVLTGSDGDVHTELDKQIKDMGMVGESILGSKVWIAQTNFPEEIGSARLSANKCILLVRNPLDSICSHFNMVLKQSLFDKLSEEEHESYSEEFDQFVKQEIEIWREFYEYWMLEPLIPTYIVRYEDLLENPKEILTDLFKFLLNANSLSGTLIESIIKEETKEDNQQYYAQNKSGYCFDKYTDDQLSYIRSEAGSTLKRLGYVTGVYGKVRQLVPTDYFDNDSFIKASAKYEKDSIVRNTTKTEVKMRYNFDDLNKNQLMYVLSESYAKLLSEKKFHKMEVNFEVEALRRKGPIDKSTKKFIKTTKK